jgi:hypothetical protein
MPCSFGSNTQEIKEPSGKAGPARKDGKGGGATGWPRLCSLLIAADLAVSLNYFVGTSAVVFTICATIW